MNQTLPLCSCAVDAKSPINMKSTKLNYVITIGLLLGLGFWARPAEAQTVISGPNIMTSTWSPAGSPYIVAANCTLPNGQTLTIQPGAIVWMGEGTSLTGNGVISAVGTSAQRITFQAISGSGKWNAIIVNNSTGTNQFKYCDLSGATNALDFRGASRNEVMFCTFSNLAGAGVTSWDTSINTLKFCSFQNVKHGVWMSVPEYNWTQTTLIANCTFSKCWNVAIYGRATATWGYQSYLNCTVLNSGFSEVRDGCGFDLWGNYNAANYIGRGHGNVQILNSSFFNVTNATVGLWVGSYAGNGSAILKNNTIMNAGSGIVLVDPQNATGGAWDATVQNNVFKNCSTAVTRSGSLSATVSYNDFHGNTTNFVGYPVTYGQVLLANRNGTPCDVLFNIFQDPQFVSASDFHLQLGSPCIDAGEGSGANFDSFFPPSMGSVTNDIGAYGGPNAGQWIVPAATNAFSLAITKIPYVSVTVNPPEPGNYRLEYASALLGTNTWLQITNLPLTTVPFTYTEPATTPARLYRAVKQ